MLVKPAYLKRAIDVIFRKVEDKAYIGKLDGTAFELSGVAWLIWQLLDGETSNEEIIEKIAKDYMLDKIEIEKDLLEFQDMLLENDLAYIVIKDEF
ncbi:hypothetical protein T458_24460 [Brevibacillus panacihumi W25]|uniref:PqqD family protein n=1 Tax=Brevibacillus panacihumi W25 TaxID=1408254 RepID=V6M9Z7_9BACL|nr:PqqD family protein [Brevibacillus panacihumi]EST52173.1 hypothetical protein T458_24460 [Brevibacillus panacihumi W25]